MAKFKMLVGLPGSGKSTHAKTMDGVVISSDEIRKELYGDESIQDDPGKVFAEVFRRTKVELDKENDAIIDATNINSKKRINALKQFNEYEKECYYFATPFGECTYNNAWRERVVDHDVIKRMYIGLHVPSYREGWNKIHIVPYHSYSTVRNDLESCILKQTNYTHLFKFLGTYFDDFKSIYELPHDNPWHTLSISRHTWYVYDYIYNNYNKEDKLVMLWTALLHDVGKGFTKSFKPGERYAHYYGHPEVGAQISVLILKGLGYDDNFVLQVADLVQLHMRLHQQMNDEQLTAFHNSIGDDLFSKLQILKTADEQAK